MASATRPQIYLKKRQRWWHPAHCKSLLSQIPARDHVKFLLYPDAHHGFDSLELPSEKQYRFGTLGYNEKAAKAAWEVVEGFLRR